MTYFSDEQEVYRYLGRMFEDLMADPELFAQFQRADTVVQYRFRDPDATVTVRMRAGESGQTDFGETSLDPEVVMTMDSDTAHRFFLGKVNLTVALAKGQIKAKGPVAKVLKLAPLVKPAFPRYRAQLEADGRADLVAA